MIQLSIGIGMPLTLCPVFVTQSNQAGDSFTRNGLTKQGDPTKCCEPCPNNPDGFFSFQFEMSAPRPAMYGLECMKVDQQIRPSTTRLLLPLLLYKAPQARLVEGYLAAPMSGCCLPPPNWTYVWARIGMRWEIGSLPVIEVSLLSFEGCE